MICHLCLWLYQRWQNQSPALDITESRLGLGWKSLRRLCWWDDGRINAANALFTRSPSTVPILTSEFVIADLRAYNLCEWYDAILSWLPLPFLVLEFLCKLHRNDPGCVVGEQRHVFFDPWLHALFVLLLRSQRRFTFLGEDDAATERPGDEWRWPIENRTDGDDDV